MNLLGTATIPVIVGMVWIMIEVSKGLIGEGGKKYIPMLATILGVALAVAQAQMAHTALTMELIFSGMVSGLSATGVNELVKNFNRDTKVTETHE